MFVMKRMIEQLPPTASELLAQQLAKIVDSYQKHCQALYAVINEHVDDISLRIHMVTFDLHATRNERDAYKAELDERP